MIESYEYCHTEQICEMGDKKFLRAIKSQRTHLAHSKVRGTRTAETAMCN